MINGNIECWGCYFILDYHRDLLCEGGIWAKTWKKRGAGSKCWIYLAERHARKRKGTCRGVEVGVYPVCLRNRKDSEIRIKSEVAGLENRAVWELELLGLSGSQERLWTQHWWRRKLQEGLSRGIRWSDLCFIKVTWCRLENNQKPTTKQRMQLGSRW